MTNVATLQTSADLSASITAQGISSLVPAGVILAFGGVTAPTGWLLCNGAAISRVTYADLFAAIGTAHGYGDNIAVTGTFNLPDYRGRFIRGRDGSVTRDPDRAGRTAANVGGNTGDNVGSVQVNATAKNGLSASSSAPTFTGSAVTSTGQNQDHTHTSTRLGIGGGYRVGDGSTAGAGQVGANDSAQTGLPSQTHTHSVTAAGTVTAPTITVGAGDSETRPVNAYVNYIIKI